ncbi:Hint domain-containing protein [Allonocardiopsis opalescens]|nr:Hint domain-containing protein [Allonocardiopsis opalescens]
MDEDCADGISTAPGDDTEPGDESDPDGEGDPDGDGPGDGPDDGPGDQPGDDEPGDDGPGDGPEDEPGDGPEGEPGDSPGDGPDDEPGDDEPGEDRPGDRPEDEPGDDEPGEDRPEDEGPEDEPGDGGPGDDEPEDRPGDEPGDGEPSPEDCIRPGFMPAVAPWIWVDDCDRPDTPEDDRPGDEPEDDRPEDEDDRPEDEREDEEEPADDRPVDDRCIDFPAYPYPVSTDGCGPNEDDDQDSPEDRPEDEPEDRPEDEDDRPEDEDDRPEDEDDSQDDRPEDDRCIDFPAYPYPVSIDGCGPGQDDDSTGNRPEDGPEDRPEDEDDRPEDDDDSQDDQPEDDEDSPEDDRPEDDEDDRPEDDRCIDFPAYPYPVSIDGCGPGQDDDSPGNRPEDGPGDEPEDEDDRPEDEEPEDDRPEDDRCIDFPAYPYPTSTDNCEPGDERDDEEDGEDRGNEPDRDDGRPRCEPGSPQSRFDRDCAPDDDDRDECEPDDCIVRDDQDDQSRPPISECVVAGWAPALAPWQWSDRCGPNDDTYREAEDRNRDRFDNEDDEQDDEQDDQDGLGRCTHNSFVADTPVLLADGTHLDIEDVAVGDLVWAHDPATGESGPRPVTDLIRGDGRKTLVTLDLAGGGTVTATDEHPFWVASDRSWTDAEDLRPGDLLTTPAGTSVQVETASVRTVAYQQVYNLTVADLHTYHVAAGGTDVLVHNDSANPPRQQCPDRPAGTIEDAMHFADIAHLLMGTHNSHPPVYTVAEVYNQRTGRYEYWVTTSGTAPSAEAMRIIQDLGYIYKPAHRGVHAEQNLVDHLGSDYQIVSGGTSNNMCTGTEVDTSPEGGGCRGVIGDDTGVGGQGMQVGGEYRGRTYQSGLRLYWWENDVPDLSDGED